MNNQMEVKNISKSPAKSRNICYSAKLITTLYLSVILVFILFNIQPLYSFSSSDSTSWVFLTKWNENVAHSNNITTLISKLRDSVTFLPLKDLRFADTAMIGNTWFLSSLNDTIEKNEAEYLYFPSSASKGRLLCIKGRDTRSGTKNSYALAWPESLPEAASVLEGLTFVSDTYYDYVNLWHGVSAMAPFVGWSLKNECAKPTRWVLFHRGELRLEMGSWLKNLMMATFGEVPVEGFEGGDMPYCFEKATVMRHNQGSMGKEKRLQVFELLRRKARAFCGVNPNGRGMEINERGKAVIRVTLLMRRGPRSFKNETAVVDIFARECRSVEGCTLMVVQSKDLISFCDQVKMMRNTNIVASPHGAQLTNMIFMDKNSSVMEFFPKGWLEHGGVGKYAHHWLATQSGMKHKGAWWDPISVKECPFPPQQHVDCLHFYKNGQLGHNETFFRQWAMSVLNQVKLSKLEQPRQEHSANSLQHTSTHCVN